MPQYAILRFAKHKGALSGVLEAHHERKKERYASNQDIDTERSAAKKQRAVELKKATKRKAEVDGLFTKLYEDWSLGKITEYNFTMLSERFQTEQQELETKIRELQEALSSMEQTESDAGKWVELIKQYASPTELTAELLNTMIEKIVVHEAVKSPDGCRKQKVDIYYRFIGKID